MRYRFSKNSESKLNTVQNPLQQVCRKALSYGVMDATIIEGRRSKENQNRYFREGKSRLKWPNGKHNVLNPDDLAQAVDIAPFVAGKVSWVKDHCLVWAGLMLAAAAELGVKIRWGGNWDMDGEPVTDQKFQDLVHFELVGD